MATLAWTSPLALSVVLAALSLLFDRGQQVGRLLLCADVGQIGSGVSTTMPRYHVAALALRFGLPNEHCPATIGIAASLRPLIGRERIIRVERCFVAIEHL